LCMCVCMCVKEREKKKKERKKKDESMMYADRVRLALFVMVTRRESAYQL
jgi:hypothetical protein